MSTKSSEHRLVELTRQSMEATNRRDFAPSATRFADDAVFDVSAVGLGRFEGIAAINDYLSDWLSAYDRQELQEWEGSHLGNGVVFVVAVFDARLRGSTSTVQERWAFTVVWTGETIIRVIARPELESARASAERLARSAE